MLPRSLADPADTLAAQLVSQQRPTTAHLLRQVGTIPSWGWHSWSVDGQIKHWSWTVLAIMVSDSTIAGCNIVPVHLQVTNAKNGAYHACASLPLTQSLRKCNHPPVPAPLDSTSMMGGNTDNMPKWLVDACVLQISPPGGGQLGTSFTDFEGLQCPAGKERTQGQAKTPPLKQ